MFPFILKLGQFQVHAHLVLEILAYSLGYRFYVYLKSRTIDLISEPDRLWIFIGAAAGGFLGAHIVGVLERPDLAPTFINFMQNKTIVGGLLGGLFGVEFTKKLLNVTTSSGDLMTFPLIFGMCGGRIGCFLEGLEDGTYGNATTLPWGVDFGDKCLRHPTQLYDIAFLLSLALIIVFIEHRYKLKNGSRFKIFLSTYFLYRFFVEYIKPNDFYIFGFCAIQICCLIGVIYYWRVFVKPLSLISK